MSAWWAGSPRTRDRSIGKQFGHRWIRSFLKTRGYSPEFSAILKADFWKLFSSGIWSARFTGSRSSSIAASELRILIDRKNVGKGKSVYGRVALGGCREIK